MKTRHLLSVVFCAAVSLALVAQELKEGSSEPPLLTLDDAVSLALRNNRLVRNSMLEAEKHDFRLQTIRSRRLPQFQFAVLSGELLHSFDFTFPAGVFGSFPGIGPVPTRETPIRTPSQLTTLATAGLDQPVTQQYKIHLGIKATELGRELAREELRAQRQKTANEIRAAYLGLVATQAGVEAGRQAVQTLEEAQKLTQRHEAERTVLHGDALEVSARLAKSRYDLSVAESGLETQREHLNQLIGRELTTVFRVAPLAEEDAPIFSLAEARERARQNRPEIRQSQLKERQAEYDRRIARADNIPDLSFSVRYLGMNNVEVLPGNVATAGFLLTWEPFDWGRRRNAVAEKSRTVEQARNGIQETQAQIAVDVGMRFRKWQDSALLLKATRLTREAAAEQLRVTTNKYKEEAALVKDLLQAQARSAEADYQYQQALATYWSALADLRRAMGEE